MERSKIISNFKLNNYKLNTQYDDFYSKFHDLNEDNIDDFEIYSTFIPTDKYSYSNYLELLSTLSRYLTEIEYELKIKIQSEELLKKIDTFNKLNPRRPIYEIGPYEIYEEEIKSDLGYKIFSSKKEKIQKLKKQCESLIFEFQFINSK